MKYVPSIAFDEMSGSAKGVTAAKVAVVSTSAIVATADQSAQVPRQQ